MGITAKKNIDIAVVGGGLLGMMSAYYLAKSGITPGMTIALFDKSKLAGESSWAGGGILTPLYPWRYADAINTLAFRSQKLYPALVADLQETSGIDPQYYNSGMLISKEDIDQHALAWLKNQGIANCVATPSNCFNLSRNDEYISLPDIHQVRNPRLASSLVSTLQHKSVALHEHCAVTQINPVSSECFELQTEQGQFYATKVVVSAGAWSGKILHQLGLSLPVKPVRGQMLLFKAQPGLLPSIILAEGKYIIPRLDGHVLVGSTMEDVGFDKRTTQQAYEDLMVFVKDRCPALAKAPVVKHWSGLRPASPNGIPFIFEHPENAGLFVNTGHFRNGVVLGPASAELLRDLLLGEQPTLNPAEYGCGRFMNDISSQSNPICSMG